VRCFSLDHQPILCFIFVLKKKLARLSSWSGHYLSLPETPEQRGLIDSGKRYRGPKDGMSIISFDLDGDFAGISPTLRRDRSGPASSGAGQHGRTAVVNRVRL
jgi:hypothetical protein